MRVTVHVIGVSRTKPQVISSSYSLDASPPMKHTNVLSFFEETSSGPDNIIMSSLYVHFRAFCGYLVSYSGPLYCA